MLDHHLGHPLAHDLDLPCPLACLYLTSMKSGCRLVWGSVAHEQPEAVCTKC